MDMKQIKELLANADVRQVLEEQIQKAVEETKAELQAEKTKLTDQRKAFEKESFIFKKTILAKSNLFEEKLKEFYENKFNEAKKKLGREVYEFINESVKNLTTAIEEDVKSSTGAVKIQEAFSRAVREMAPHMNINEIVGKNQTDIDELKKKLNETTKKLKIAEAKSLTVDLHTLVVSECAGYPTEKIALLYETVLKLEPKNLTEGKLALDAAKNALKEKEIELNKQIEEAKVVVTEGTVPEAVAPSVQRNKLKVIAEDIANKKNEPKTTVTSNIKDVSANDYEIYLG